MLVLSELSKRNASWKVSCQGTTWCSRWNRPKLLVTKTVNYQQCLNGLICWMTSLNWSGKQPSPNKSPEGTALFCLKLLNWLPGTSVQINWNHNLTEGSLPINAIFFCNKMVINLYQNFFQWQAAFRVTGTTMKHPETSCGSWIVRVISTLQPALYAFSTSTRQKKKKDKWSFVIHGFTLKLACLFCIFLHSHFIRKEYYPPHGAEASWPCSQRINIFTERFSRLSLELLKNCFGVFCEILT